ncbi:MAG: hypothetical protein ABFD29_00355, partial [Anaerolineaceae bacterium]
MSSLFWFLLILFLLLNIAVTMVYASRKYVRSSGLLVLQEQSPEAVERTTNLLKKPYLDATLVAATVIMHLILGGFSFWFVFQNWPVAQSNVWVLLGVSVGAA